jgi:tetratricopeptide (TPR) repeat protein
MIERLLAAESALARGELETARRLYAQIAEGDPRNAIAVVGLARIATRDGRADEARALLGRALVIDPDEAAARRLLRELEAPARAAVSEPATVPVPAPVPEPATMPAPGHAPAPAAAAPIQILAPVPAAGRPSLLDRLRGWLAGLRRRG